MLVAQLCFDSPEDFSTLAAGQPIAMPTTYNGIGTHYYGKKNLETRHAACDQCGREVPLSSYDTRLWFVIFFIPLIPLGRKRIINQCPACTRHYALDLDKWETTKQLEISGALDKFRSNPTPEAAIETHQALVNFHQTAEAAEFRQAMRAKFPDNARVHAYLGAVLEHLGQTEEAAAAFAKALALRPDLPEARVGVAKSHIRAKRFAEARALLDFLEKPGAHQLYSLEPLEILALALQNDGRHDEALQLFSKLLEALPALGDHTGYRKNVEKSEKAMRRQTSVLPRRKFSWKRFLGADPTAAGSAGTAGPQVTWRGLAWVGAVCALVLLGFVVRNEYVRRHRTLHIVNVLPHSATVEIRGVGQVRAPRGTTEFTLGEGRHHASISGVAPEEIDFELRTSFLDRWFNDPVWILNVGGAAVLTLTTATYSRNPTPPSLAFRFGQAFEFFPDVSHAFTPLPESLRMKSHESRTLTQLEVQPEKPLAVFQYFEGQSQWSEALRLAEVTLRFHPGDAPLLYSYVNLARSRRQAERVEQFLKPGLTNRPVQIEWHRAYQSLHPDREGEARLAVQYDALLQAEPGNSALLYLRGRVSPTRGDSRRYFERSAAADPANAYPLYAQGWDRMAMGDWAGSREFLQKAVKLRPDDVSFAHYLAQARFALGEFESLEQELRDRLKRNPADLAATLQLCEVLVAAGTTNDAAQAVNAFELAARGRHGAGSVDISKHLRRRLLYATGDFAGLERHAARDNTPAGQLARFEALIEQGRVAEAAKARTLNPGEPGEGRGFDELLVALAWTLQGNAAEAAQSRDRALKALEAGATDWARAAEVLRSAVPPSQAELDEVAVAASSKAVLLAALAHRHPTRRAEFAAAARRFNIGRGFPYHLVQRATAPASGQ
jgi:tetratricopeptide (TPR) repeat protein